MKKNLLKRIGAVALALAVSLTMGVSAYAADAPEQNLYGNSINIPKDIVIYNTDASTVYEPNITYTYTVAAGSAGKTVTDKDNKSAVTKAGPDGGLLIKGNASGATAASTATLEFGKTETAAAATDSSSESTAVASAKKVTKNLEVTCDISKFSVPGVYRYKLSESSTGYDAAGVTKGSASDDRYLDVYVRWKDTNKTTLEVYGLTMFKTDENITYKAGETVPDFKLTGYDVSSEEAIKGSGSGAGVDTYHTYNVVVKKVVDGTLGDTTHPFPFAVTLAESAATAVEFYSTDNYANGHIEFSSGSFAVNDQYGTALKLKHNETVTFVGLPKTTTATVGEKDDTSDTYAATATATSGDVTLTNNTSEKTWVTSSAVSAPSTLATNTITFTNKLDEISPTNVVMRFAPYLFILGAAIVLLVLMRRRRASQDAE